MKYLFTKKKNILVISLISLVLFLVLSTKMILNPEPFDFEVKFLTTLGEIRITWLNQLMKFATFLGEGYVIIFLVVLSSSVLFLTKKYKYIATLIVIVGMGLASTVILKEIITRIRPDIIEHLVDESSYSFPSGHALNSMVLYGFLVYILFKETRKKNLKNLFIFFGAVIIFAIGFSRMYLGVHWPSDIIGGYLVGISLLTLFIVFFEDIQNVQNMVLVYIKSKFRKM